MKLVTGTYQKNKYMGGILIHTSVKLVTRPVQSRSRRDRILIHTSVKLVTHVGLPYTAALEF